MLSTIQHIKHSIDNNLKSTKYLFKPFNIDTVLDNTTTIYFYSTFVNQFLNKMLIKCEWRRIVNCKLVNIQMEKCKILFMLLLRTVYPNTVFSMHGCTVDAAGRHA